MSRKSLALSAAVVYPSAVLGGFAGQWLEHDAFSLPSLLYLGAITLLPLLFEGLNGSAKMAEQWQRISDFIDTWQAQGNITIDNLQELIDAKVKEALAEQDVSPVVKATPKRSGVVKGAK